MPVRARWHESWKDENGDEVPALKDLKQDIGNMLNKALAAVEDESDVGKLILSRYCLAAMDLKQSYRGAGFKTRTRPDLHGPSFFRPAKDRTMGIAGEIDLSHTSCALCRENFTRPEFGSGRKSHECAEDYTNERPQ